MTLGLPSSDYTYVFHPWASSRIQRWALLFRHGWQRVKQREDHDGRSLGAGASCGDGGQYDGLKWRETRLAWKAVYYIVSRMTRLSLEDRWMFEDLGCISGRLLNEHGRGMYHLLPEFSAKEVWFPKRSSISCRWIARLILKLGPIPILDMNFPAFRSFHHWKVSLDEKKIFVLPLRSNSPINKVCAVQTLNMPASSATSHPNSVIVDRLDTMPSSLSKTDAILRRFSLNRRWRVSGGMSDAKNWAAWVCWPTWPKMLIALLVRLLLPSLSTWSATTSTRSRASSSRSRRLCRSIRPRWSQLKITPGKLRARVRAHTFRKPRCPWPVYLSVNGQLAAWFCYMRNDNLAHKREAIGQWEIPWRLLVCDDIAKMVTEHFDDLIVVDYNRLCGTYR